MASYYYSSNIVYVPNDSSKVSVDARGGPSIIYLPLESEENIVIIKSDSSVNTVTVATINGSLIDGSVQYVLSSENEFVTVASNQAGWSIVDSNSQLISLAAQTAQIANELSQIAQDVVEVGVNKYNKNASGILHHTSISNAGVTEPDAQLLTTDFIFVPYGTALVFTSLYNGARSVLTFEGDNTIVRCLCVYELDKETTIQAQGFGYQSGKIAFYNITTAGDKYVKVSLLEGNIDVVADIVPYDTDEWTTYTASLGLDDYYTYTETHRTEVKKTAIESWYKGKTLAIIGDSITELESWLPFVEDALGCTFVNLGVGGSTVCDCSARTDYICSDGRINAIPLYADGVIVWGGHNDWGNQATVGTITPNWTLSDALSKGEFVSALALTFKKIIARIPDVPVLSMSLLNGRTALPNVNADSQMYLNNLCMTDFSNAIKTISEYYSIPCIDIGANAGVSVLNHTANILADDIIHPNVNGGKKIATEMINGLIRYQPNT